MSVNLELLVPHMDILLHSLLMSFSADGHISVDSIEVNGSNKTKQFLISFCAAVLK